MRGRRRAGRAAVPAVLGAALATVLALTACGDGTAGGAGASAASSGRPGAVASSGASSGTSSAAPSAPTAGAPAYRSPRDYTPVAEPTRVRIPAIGVRSSLDRLGRAGDGTVEVPRRWERAGWYTGGFRPGQPGPAVILGHVDSRTGPAVFYRLRSLRPGDIVLVDRKDSTTARFRVTRVERYRKTRFPSDLVYFPTLEPSLRLVTCGGTFDTSSGHYRDNVIVLATAV